jgi:hypothetical protein
MGEIICSTISAAMISLVGSIRKSPQTSGAGFQVKNGIINLRWSGKFDNIWIDGEQEAYLSKGKPLIIRGLVIYNRSKKTSGR